MDVEKVKKISKMAEVLQSKGMANSKEEAIKQAEEYLNKDKDGEVSDLPNDTDDIKIEEENEEEGDVNMDDLKEAMSKNTKYIVKVINEFKDEIKSIKGQIDGFKSEIEGIKRKMNDIKKGEPKEKQEKIEEKEEKKESHPRRGNYSGDDVAIEDFFYYGNK